MANFEIPTEMRNHAEQSVEQAKKAFDDFITAAQKAVTAFEGQAAGAKASAKNTGEKAMAFAEKNVATSFEFAQKVVRAKDIQELMQLQTEFVKTQMPAFVEQARALGQTVAQDAVRPTT
jgi:phasin